MINFVLTLIEDVIFIEQHTPKIEISEDATLYFSCFLAAGVVTTRTVNSIACGCTTRHK
jgi:hypothetical protein